MQEENKGWQNGQKNLSDFVITENCPEGVLQVRNQNVRGITSIARETKKESLREKEGKGDRQRLRFLQKKYRLYHTKKKKKAFYKKRELLDIYSTKLESSFLDF